MKHVVDITFRYSLVLHDVVLRLIVFTFAAVIPIFFSFLPLVLLLGDGGVKKCHFFFDSLELAEDVLLEGHATAAYTDPHLNEVSDDWIRYVQVFYHPRLIQGLEQFFRVHGKDELHDASRLF